MARPTEHGEIWEARADKLRPVVVVSRDDTRGVRTKTTVAVVTSSLRDAASFVLLDHRDGLPAVSAINCDELHTIDKALLQRRVGRLSETKLAELDHALRFALELD